MADLRVLKSQPVPFVSPTAVEVLESALADVKAGRVKYVAVLTLDGPDKIWTGWSRECGDDVFRVYGALNYLAQFFFDAVIAASLEPTDPKDNG